MTHEEARLFVREHLRRRGHERVEVTQKLVRYWWNILNVAVFYGRLNKPDEIRIKRRIQHYAATEVNIRHKGHVNIIIRETFTLRLWFMSILVHEMVHAWEHQHHTIMGHGKRFFAWKNRIKWTVNLELRELYHYYER